MKGNTIAQFIDDLLLTGGPEKEFTFRGKRYFLETIWRDEKQMNEMYIFEVSETNPVIFSCFGKRFEDCVREFEKACIFDGLNIYQAEQEIEVIFG